MQCKPKLPFLLHRREKWSFLYSCSPRSRIINLCSYFYVKAYFCFGFSFFLFKVTSQWNPQDYFRCLEKGVTFYIYFSFSEFNSIYYYVAILSPITFKSRLIILTLINNDSKGMKIIFGIKHLNSLIPSRFGALVCARQCFYLHARDKRVTIHKLAVIYFMLSAHFHNYNNILTSSFLSF